MTQNALLLLQNVHASSGIDLRERVLPMAPGTLFTHDGTLNELVAVPIGNNYEVLMANSAVSTGFDWVTPFSSLSLSGVILTSVVDPDLVNASDLNLASASAIKGYVDARITQGISYRPPVDAVFNSGGSSLPATGTGPIDGVTIIAGLRVLVLNSSLAGQVNRIMVSSGSSSAWTWAQEIDDDGDTINPSDGFTTWVKGGTTYADQRYTYNGTAWVQTGGSSLYVGSTSISISSGTISVIRKTASLNGGTEGLIDIGASGIFVSLGTTSTTAAAGNHTHTNMITGTGTNGYVAYFSGTNTIAAEQYLSTSRGGLGGTVAAAPRNSLLCNSSSNTVFTFISPDVSDVAMYLRTKSTGGASTTPAWAAIQASDIAGGASITEAGGNNVLSFSSGANTAALTAYTITVNPASISTNGFLTSGNFISFNNRIGSWHASSEVTGTIAAGGQANCTIGNAAVIGKELTGYTAGSGNISATDTILTAFQKLGYDKHVALSLASGVTQAALSLSVQTLTLQGDLAAVEGLAANGIATRTATDTWVVRTITGTGNRVSVSNGDGVSGNPTINIDTTLFPSPVAGDVDKLLICTAANTNLYKALAVGTTGTAPGWVINASNITLNIPLAATASVTAGLVSKTSYDSWTSIATNGITSLTGDVTTTGSGAATASIAATVVTGKVLTGLGTLADGTIDATVSILNAIKYLAYNKHAAVTLSTQGTNAGLSLSTQQLSLAYASTSTAGALTSADWNTFSNKMTWYAGTAPTSSTSAGTAGHFYYDPSTGMLYLCILTGTSGVAKWVRFAGAKWD